MAADETKTEPLTIGDTTKKTINRTLVIGAALTAAVTLTPAVYARETHHEPANGIQLATDIVNLVRAIVEPLPAPVIVEAPPTVIEKTVVVEKPVVVEKTVVVATAPKVVTTTPTTVIVTGTKAVTIPEYSYLLYEDEYIPYYEGWIYYRDIWHWIGAEPRPPAPPRWKPEAHHHGPGHRKVIVLPERRHAPVPVVRHEAPRREPVVVRHEAPRREPVVARHEAPPRETARTVVVRPDRKDATHANPPKYDGPKKAR